MGGVREPATPRDATRRYVLFCRFSSVCVSEAAAQPGKTKQTKRNISFRFSQWEGSRARDATRRYMYSSVCDSEAACGVRWPYARFSVLSCSVRDSLKRCHIISYSSNVPLGVDLLGELRKNGQVAVHQDVSVAISNPIISKHGTPRIVMFVQSSKT